MAQIERGEPLEAIEPDRRCDTCRFWDDIGHHVGLCQYFSGPDGDRQDTTTTRENIDSSTAFLFVPDPNAEVEFITSDDFYCKQWRAKEYS